MKSRLLKDKYARLKVNYRNDQVAEEYDRLRFEQGEGKKEDDETRIALHRALAHVPRGGSILDLPCGTGRFYSLLQKEYRYHGCDISKEMILELKKKSVPDNDTDELRAVCCDAECLPFKGVSFDCVLTARFLHFVPGDIRRNMLREFARVSRGSLIVIASHLEKVTWARRARIFLRALSGKDTDRFRVANDVLASGWREMGREEIGVSGLYVAIYEKR